MYKLLLIFVFQLFTIYYVELKNSYVSSPIYAKSSGKHVPVFLIEHQRTYQRRTSFRRRFPSRRRYRIKKPTFILGKNSKTLKLDLSTLSRLKILKNPIMMSRGKKSEPKRIIQLTSKTITKLNKNVVAAQKKSSIVFSAHSVNRNGEIYRLSKSKPSKTMFLLSEGREFHRSQNATTLHFHFNKNHLYKNIDNIRLNLRLAGDIWIISAHLTEPEHNLKYELKKNLEFVRLASIAQVGTKWIKLDFTTDVKNIMKRYQNLNRFDLYLVVHTEGEKISRTMEDSYISVDIKRPVSRKRREHTKSASCGMRSILVNFDSPMKVYGSMKVMVSYCAGSCDEKTKNRRMHLLNKFHKCCVATETVKSKMWSYFLNVQTKKYVRQEFQNSLKCECR